MPMVITSHTPLASFEAFRGLSIFPTISIFSDFYMVFLALLMFFDYIYPTDHHISHSLDLTTIGYTFVGYPSINFGSC